MHWTLAYVQASYPNLISARIIGVLLRTQQHANQLFCKLANLSVQRYSGANEQFFRVDYSPVLSPRLVAQSPQAEAVCEDSIDHYLEYHAQDTRQKEAAVST